MNDVDNTPIASHDQIQHSVKSLTADVLSKIIAVDKIKVHLMSFINL